MFKKILLIFISLLFLSFPCFAQDQYVENINGHDWMGMSTNAKILLVTGIFIGLSAVNQAVLESDLPEEIKNRATKFLIISEDTHTAVAKIEYYYRVTEDLQASVWSVLFLVYGKSWWPLKEREEKKEIIPGPFRPYNKLSKKLDKKNY